MGARAGRVAGWFKSYKAALSHKDLRLLFSGLIVSATGSWAYNVGLLALVYERTHSLSWVGGAGLARFAPALLTSTYAGVLAERTERIRLLVSSDALCMIWQIGLALVASSRGPLGLALLFSALTSVTLSITGSAVSLVSAVRARLSITRQSREAEVDLTATPQIDLTEARSLTSGAGENLVSRT